MALTPRRVGVFGGAFDPPHNAHVALVQSALDRLMKNRTSFIIAHRLSTVRNADRILVMENGRIVEQGNHNQLLVLQGAYYRLYMSQFAGEEETAVDDSTAVHS